MDLSKLSYSKGEPGLTQRDPVHVPSKEAVRNHTVLELPKASPTYSKKEGVLSTNLVFVLSGGEKREKDFLLELIKQRTIRSLRVVFMSEQRQGLQPFQMHERWKEIQTKGVFKIDSQEFHLDAMDKVFLLSDVDEFYNQLVKILSTDAEKEQGQWIISNPCFEIWLYYCYLNNPERDLARLKTEPIRTRSKLLKTLCSELRSGGFNSCLAFEHLKTGIENSLAHFNVDENGVPKLYATNMYEMATFLVDTMNQYNDEYEIFLKRKAEWRNKMKANK